MPNQSPAELLDERIEALLARADSAVPDSDADLGELLAVAEALQTIPAADFKARLKADLLDQAFSAQHSNAFVISPLPSSVEIGRATRSSTDSGILPSLFGGREFYPVHRASFMASAVAHAAALALLITVGIFAAQGSKEIPRVSSVLVTDLNSYRLPAAADRVGGGGGGGDRSRLQASRGTPPRFAFEQITPPVIVVRNEADKLRADPTVVGPPELSFPQNGQVGDPLSKILERSSNGTGSGGGIGTGARGGVGPGNGPGVGEGYGGGIGGGPYVAGHGVSAPRAIYDPEPDYSDEARRAKYQGVVVLRVVVGSDGRPQDMRVARTLGMGLDEKATEAVRQWRFQPGYKDGQAVAVVVDIEVHFRLY
jgi:TonB family protein